MEIGFTGTRHGMTRSQWSKVCDIASCIDGEFQERIVAHHGCCVESDEAFAVQCREWGMLVVGHPPQIKAFESRIAVAASHELRAPAPYWVRNQAIVDASNVMIAAPAEAEPQRAGGTWMTIRMALRALRDGHLDRIHVIAPDGSELDHRGWSA